MTVAETILAQMGGGRRLAIMTGAKNFTAGKNTLSFQIPRANGIQGIYIELMADDTYTMTFYKFRKYERIEVAKAENVYCDQLQTIFTEKTGLATHL